MKKRMAIIHTSFVSVQDLSELCAEIIPDVEVTNIVDDSLLPEVRDHQGLTPSVIRRVCTYALEAEQMGMDLILNQCSSVGGAVDVARTVLRTPYLKIDEEMALQAAKIGGKISVIATVPTTLKPSCGLVQEAADKLGKKADIVPCLVDGAFDMLMTKGKAEHNRMVIEYVRREAETVQCIVLAQGSMYCLMPELSGLSVPVLSSPRLGIQSVRRYLEKIQ